MAARVPQGLRAIRASVRDNLKRQVSPGQPKLAAPSASDASAAETPRGKRTRDTAKPSLPKHNNLFDSPVKTEPVSPRRGSTPAIPPKTPVAKVKTEPVSPRKTASPTKKLKSPRAKLAKQESATPSPGKRRRVEVQYETTPPHNWEHTYEQIKLMRMKRDAVVDTMGAEAICDFNAPPKELHLQVLLSALLSSQTKDQITSAALLKLREHGCTVDNLLATSEQDIAKLIYPVGFYNTKAKNIHKVCRILKEEHEGDVPSDMKGLLALPGVGPKMAHLYLNVALEKPQGICVDTHVHRIANRLGWAKTSGKNQKEEDTRKALEAWMPREHWPDVNLLLVGFGQQICQPVKPRCSDCLLAATCPSSSLLTSQDTPIKQEPKTEKEEE